MSDLEKEVIELRRENQALNQRIAMLVGEKRALINTLVETMVNVGAITERLKQFEGELGDADERANRNDPVKSR